MDEDVVALQKAITFRVLRLGVKKIGFADVSGVGHSLTGRKMIAVTVGGHRRQPGPGPRTRVTVPWMPLDTPCGCRRTHLVEIKKNYWM